MSILSNLIDAVTPAPKRHPIAEALDAALLECSTALAAVADPPSPTLASIPEALAEHETALESHRTACAANADKREAVLAAAAKRLATRLNDAPGSFVAQTRAALEATDAALAQLQDPEPPQLGTPTATLVSALTQALRKHSQALRAAEALRDDARQTLLANLRALRQAQVAGGTQNGQIFNGRLSAGMPVDFDYIAQQLGGLNQQLCEIFRSAVIGSDAEAR